MLLLRTSVFCGADSPVHVPFAGTNLDFQRALGNQGHVRGQEGSLNFPYLGFGTTSRLMFTSVFSWTILDFQRALGNQGHVRDQKGSGFLLFFSIGRT